MKKYTFPTIAALLALTVSISASAAPVFSLSASVTSTDRSATFNALTSNGLSLANYSEGGLSVTDNDITFVGFSPFSPLDNRTTQYWYPSGGNSNFATIKGSDDAVFSAIDFLMGDGQGGNTTNLRWITLLDGVQTGAGTVSNVARGSIVGWSDVAGFDELRVAAASSESLPGFGNHQSIAIDNLRAQLSATRVPEPASLMLLGLGLAGLAFSRRKKA